jgi:hypothetical protein
MKLNVLIALIPSILLSGFLVRAAITSEQARQLPPPADHQINFSAEIKPILEASCIKCHGRGRAKGDFRIDSRETLLKGGSTGPAVVPGKSVESLLIELVMGFDPDNQMPKKGSKLTRDQIGVLRAWIDQGLVWDSTITFARAEPLNLKPRRPQVPASRDPHANQIDLLLQPYYEAHHVQPAKVIDDRLFARRVYLDLIGLLPPKQDLEKFVSSKEPDKRHRLAKRLLADNQNYAIHWLTFWNDALRNDYRGTGYIDGGRLQITKWLYASLAGNLPYDQFVSQLIDPKAEAEGFVKGIVWRGAVNASQMPHMQAAQNISQVFMGVNLKCASCHDSFINDWMLADAYGLAGLYADEPLEMVHCDKPTGERAPLKFIYPQLGQIDPNADKPARLKQLVAVICGRQDGRLTRTLVNRLWRQFMGRGLVEPVDDMERPAWQPDLLDWLAEDFADHGYDVKHVIEQIVTSRAYQVPAISAGEQNPGDFVFRGPTVRRLTAEEFRDALTSVIGIGYPLPIADVNYATGKPATESATAVGATPKWIWNDPAAAQKAAAGAVYLRKDFSLPVVPEDAAVMVVCDNTFVLHVNGKKVGEGNDFSKPYFFEIGSRLKKGQNFLSVKAINNLPGNVAPKEGEAAPGQENPAGLLLYARLRHNINVYDIVSDSSWRWSARAKEWDQPSFDAANWKPASELGGISIAPWNLSTNYVQKMFAGVQAGKVRAALVYADPLQTALGRPNREQVVTTRATTATTLEALELTNGPELAGLLQKGAEKILSENPTLNSRDLTVQLYESALGRRPNAKELHLAAEILGEKPQQAGVEDLIWTVAMLPEFQLIY